MDYLEQSLAMQSSMELVVALYDGMLRFLHQAVACVESGDANGRRRNIKYTLEILTYLQGRLRTDVGIQRGFHRLILLQRQINRAVGSLIAQVIQRVGEVAAEG